MSAALLRNHIDKGNSHTYLSGSTAGNKGVTHPLQHLAVHTLAIIADAENKVPLFIFADSQPDVTGTGSHRILGYIQDV